MGVKIYHRQDCRLESHRVFLSLQTLLAQHIYDARYRYDEWPASNSSLRLPVSDIQSIQSYSFLYTAHLLSLFFVIVFTCQKVTDGHA